MSQATVLVIEDDEVFQSVVRNYLRQLDYDVHCTVSGRAGLELTQRLAPDIVLCDLKLPDINGLQVIERLFSQNPELPVIVISASEQMADIHDAVSLGAWDYLVKPLDSLNVINDAIQHCLNRYQLEETYLHDRCELDDHLDILYQDDALVERLKHELVPAGPLLCQQYQFAYQLLQDSPPVWIDYRTLLDNKVLVICASAHNATEQSLVPLLVLKTLIDPLVRQYMAKADTTLLSPRQVLTHVNKELCHSRIRAAFDAVVGIFDTQTGNWRWAQAGEQLRSRPSARPDLALGIWQHASYHQNDAEQVDESQIDCADFARLTIRRGSPQTGG